MDFLGYFLTNDEERAVKVETTGHAEFVGTVVERPAGFVDANLVAPSRGTRAARDAARRAGLRLRKPERMTMMLGTLDIDFYGEDARAREELDDEAFMGL